MKIRDVECKVISIPLRRPAAVSNRVITAREYTIARVIADDGLCGVGCTVGGRAVKDVVEDLLKPQLVRMPAFAIETLWDRMFSAALQLGRRGVAMRAISIVDIALWDLKGKALGLPVARLLGSSRDRVPVYASGGYYCDGKGPAELAAEAAGYVAQGFRAVKIRAGRLEPREDLKRIEAVRRAVGDDVEIMVDANHAWRDPSVAVRFAQAMAPFGIRWLEEPVPPDDLQGAARLAAAVEIPIASGELESTRWAFRDLIVQQAADILQPDASVVGGISEWLKVAALASAFHTPLAPHYVWEVHAHLAAVVPSVLYVEYFTREADLVGFDDVLQEPLRPVDGYLPVPAGPGLGIELDDEAVERFRIA